MADLGDLTNFMKEGSGAGPADLDWLDVSEKDYQELDRLPKQNLDVVPDLEAAWAHRDEPSTYYVPNTGAPKTMGDLSQEHGPIRLEPPEDLMVRTARMAIMASTDPMRIRHALESRFDKQAIMGAKTALASVFAERGLLGRYYIAASDFPGCHKGGKQASEFVRRFASEAKFVQAKPECQSCIHRQALTMGGDHCSVFHKQIVMDVPYSEELADEVEKLQEAKGKSVQASKANPKERIRQAFLAQSARVQAGFSGRPQQAQAPVPTGNAQEQLISVANLTKKRETDAMQKLAEQKAQPIVTMVRRELLKGRTAEEVAKALRLAFDERDLRATQAFWAPLYREAGLYGAVYSTQDSFDNCREGADFLSKHGSLVRAIVAGDKCGSCIFNKVGRCLMYGRKLVASKDSVLTPEVVAAVFDEHKMAGRLPVGSEKMAWGSTPAEALKSIHTAAMSPQPVRPGSVRSVIEQAFHGGGSREASTSDLTKRSILKSAKQYMNEGLYGEDLVTVMKSRFEIRDLIATAPELKKVLAEQGLQGIKYVDPSVYDDYGKGCKEAQRKHRSRAAVKYAKVGDKCGSCVHQTRPGFCSILDKQLVVEPPYVDKAAEQKAVLASGRATEVSYADLMNNGLSMMQEYELQHREAGVDLRPETAKIEATIEFGNQEVKL